MPVAIDLFRRDTVLLTDRCRHGHGLPGVGTGGHYPCSAESHMAYANDAPGEKQVFDVFAIQCTIRDLEDALAVPLVAGLALTEYAIGRVQVDRPATIRHRIRMVPLLDEVALSQNVFPFDTAALPLPHIGRAPGRERVWP